ncbi:hypothetical protein L7F22_066651 [Adiantum nelumboides]|nr:hypothetical protein [Adiantum nelumboides]
MKSVAGSSSGPPRTPLPSFASLTRQPSIYTLTLEELQNAVNEPGKNFGSMNMEEFIKNIWTVEESQAMAAAMTGVAEGNGSSSTGSTSLPPTSLQHGLSMPRNLTGKTVDEVWKEIHRSNDRRGPENLEHRQVTMGEVTLEDFLAKAGFTREEGEVEPSANNSNSVVTMNNGTVSNAPADGMEASQVAPHQIDWLNFQLKGNMPHQQLLHRQHLLQQQQQAAAAAAFAGRLAAPTAAVMPAVTAPNVVDASFDSTGNMGPAHVLDVSFDSNGGAGLLLSSALVGSDRKRPHDAIEEKSIENRQKRMIKNRESAARSRARKQAYNVELESEVELLKEENVKLLQQQVLAPLQPDHCYYEKPYT